MGREKREVFRFKQFECRHFDSSMRIGVDAVLLGAWADVSGKRILDVGTGCGVIALMCAQRNSEARVDAIDIDEASVSEARGNFESSPWSERLNVKVADFTMSDETDTYDHIVSNPPYFNSGVNNADSSRLRARHEAALSPAVLLTLGAGMISDSGTISMVVPYERSSEIITAGKECGLSLLRRLDVRGHDRAPLKRSLLEFGKCGTEMSAASHEELTLELERGVPTDEYRCLCGDFYLYF